MGVRKRLSLPSMGEEKDSQQDCGARISKKKGRRKGHEERNFN